MHTKLDDYLATKRVHATDHEVHQKERCPPDLKTAQKAGRLATYLESYAKFTFLLRSLRPPPFASARRQQIAVRIGLVFIGCVFKLQRDRARKVWTVVAQLHYNIVVRGSRVGRCTKAFHRQSFADDLHQLVRNIDMLPPFWRPIDALCSDQCSPPNLCLATLHFATLQCIE